MVASELVAVNRPRLAVVPISIRTACEVVAEKWVNARDKTRKLDEVLSATARTPLDNSTVPFVKAIETVVVAVEVGETKLTRVRRPVLVPN